MKPMSLAYSRKQRRHRSRPYLRMMPWVLLHTRLPQHSTQQKSAPRDGMALHPLDRTAQLCSTSMVIAAAQQRTPQLTPGAGSANPSYPPAALPVATNSSGMLVLCFRSHVRFRALTSGGRQPSGSSGGCCECPASEARGVPG